MKKIVCEWIEEKEWGYNRAMRVIKSDHPRFVVGSRFDWGFASVAGCQGYALEILPVPAELVTPSENKVFEVSSYRAERLNKRKQGGS